MRSAKDLLERMGFNREAPESTKQAFLKNLERSLNHSHKAEVIPIPETINKKQLKTQPKEKPQQLSFDLDDNFRHEPQKKRS